MEGTQIYCLYGEPLYDMAIYLAILLHRLGEEVLVVDGSKNQHTVECVKSYGWGEVVSYRQVDFCRESSITGLQKDTYSIVLWIGANEKKQDSGGTYIFTDFIKEHLTEAVRRMQESEGHSSLILRDISNDKLGIGYFESLLPEKDKNIGKVWKLPLDYGDFDYRIRLEHEPLLNFRQLSKEMLDCLSAILVDMTGKPEKEIGKAIRKKEGYGCQK